MNCLFKTVAICLISITAISCSRTPEREIIHLLNNKYANLYVNESQKREAINELKEFLKENHLSDQTYPKIQEYVHKISDGHVVLYRNNFMTQNAYVSGLNFIPGSPYVRSCESCTPAVPEGKFKILEINDIPLEKYLKAHASSVAASTPPARAFRVLRKLTENGVASEIRLKLQNVDRSLVSTTLNWQKVEPGTHKCVSGERLDEKTFKLNIHSLWCDDKTNLKETRHQVLMRFKQEFDNVAQSISKDDLIVLDLRENGGGGDQEVEYVLNSFSDKPLFMYRYQYLAAHTSQFKKWLARLSIQPANIWAEEEFLYSNPQNKTTYQFFENKMITLVSEGCFSSCEGLASSLKLENRSLLLGTRTHGGAGDPIVFPIKNSDFSLNLPTCLAWQKDGNLFEGTGVEPNIKTTQNFTNISDSVLEEGLKKIRE